MKRRRIARASQRAAAQRLPRITRPPANGAARLLASNDTLLTTNVVLGF